MIAYTRPLRRMSLALLCTDDNDDPFTFNPQGFNSAWKRNDAFVDYAQAASAHGQNVYFPAPLRLPPRCLVTLSGVE